MEEAIMEKACTSGKTQYSEEYQNIRKKVESQWPQWKKEIYNTRFATSKHAKKI